MEKGKKWYQSPSNWLFIVACVILIPMLLMNLSIMFQAKTNEDKVPSVFGLKPFMVLSGSMEPGIKKGDLIITKVVDPETLKIDDVIAFRDSQNTVTTHRIIDIVTRNNSNYFITKGDNNASQDQNLVSLSDVEGVFALRIPGIGSLMKSLSEPTTIVILVLGITVIFVITFMISSKKQMGKEDADYLEYKRMKKQQEKHISVFEDNEEEEDYPIRKKEEHKSLKQYNNRYEKPFKQKNDRDYNHYSQNKNDEEEEDYLDKYMEEANKPKPYNNRRERNFEYQKNKYSEKQQRNEQEEEEDILEYKKRVEQLEEEKYNRNDDFNESQKRYSNKEQRYEKDREKSFEYKKMNRQEDRRHQDRNQEFFEYKKQQEQEEKQSQYDREREEFLEYKRMKEEQRRKEQEEKEREEFQAYKRMKEEQENSRRRR